MHRSSLLSPAALIAAALILFAGPLKPARAQDDDDAKAMRADFSAQVAEIGQNWLRTGSRNAPQFEQAAAMLRGAMKSDPNDPRYPRLLASALQQLNDGDGQIAAWNTYLKIVAADHSEDRAAETRLIELYVSKMQTNEEKLKYLKGLMGKATLPVEIRAHLAVMCAPLLQQRSNDEAAAIVAEGLKLYPLPELLQWQYYLSTAHAGPVDRIVGLLAWLRSNPIQPTVIDAIARELAMQGMAEDSAEWFSTELGVAQRMGLRYDAGFYLDLASELYLAGQNQLARQWAAKVLDADPNNMPVWFLSLSIARSAHDQVAFIETSGLARDALSRRWGAIIGEILKRSGGPASQPAGQQMPDLPALLEKLHGINDRQLNEAFAQSLEDIIWFALFYQQSPPSAAPYLTALEKALLADNPTLQRLQGWSAAESGKDAEAREHFTAAAEHDPIAALGLIRLDHGKDSHVRDRMRELLNKNPTGLTAVMIREMLINEEAAAPATKPAAGATTAPAQAAAVPTTGPTSMPTTNPATADAIRAELKKFPSGWFLLIDQPQRFYGITVDPVQTRIRFGDPLMARVTITNLSAEDLVIGFGGPLAPSLWFNAKVTGIAQQELPAVAYDQIAGPIVLRGHASSTQIIRIDQGPLGELLLQRANGSMIVSGNVMTNPVTFAGNVVPVAGGQQAVFARSFVRLPSDLQADASKRQLREDFTTGTANDRLHDLQLMGSFIAGMDKEANPAIRDSADFCIQALGKGRSDPTPEVAAWAGYLAATLPGVPGRLETIQQMLASASWQTRLLAVAAIRQQPTDVQQRLCPPISENDPEPAVKSLATAMLEALKLPATQPATEPAAQPAITK